MEQALIYELSKIKAFNGKIFPTNIPQGEKPPYLAYIMSYYNQLRTLTEILDDTEQSYLLNVFCKSYLQMKDLTEKVKSSVYGFIGKSIGETPIFIENVIINNISETYENELELYRGILDIKIFR